jgi:hypothetical protein
MKKNYFQRFLTLLLTNKLMLNTDIFQTSFTRVYLRIVRTFSLGPIKFYDVIM